MTKLEPSPLVPWPEEMQVPGCPGSGMLLVPKVEDNAEDAGGLEQSCLEPDLVRTVKVEADEDDDWPAASLCRRPEEPTAPPGACKAEPPCATSLPLPSSPHLGATSPWEPLHVPSAPRPFSCAQCGKSFGKKAHLTRHLRVHTGERPYPCGECGRRFRQKIHLRSHQKTHTGERPFPCGECGRRFRKKTHLVRHHRTHTGERPFGCACGRRFAHKQHLLRHQRSHQTLEEDVKPSPHVETFGEVSARCLRREEPPCAQAALAPLTFLAESCHKPNPGGHRWLQRLVAPGKVGGGGGGVTTAPRPFVCELCGRRFGRKSHLARHQAVHTGTRPHACGQCAKSFSSKTNLARHQAVHTGHRPFACARCGKSFSRKSHLRRHEGTHGHADAQGWAAATTAVAP